MADGRAEVLQTTKYAETPTCFQTRTILASYACHARTILLPGCLLAFFLLHDEAKLKTPSARGFPYMQELWLSCICKAKKLLHVCVHVYFFVERYPKEEIHSLDDGRRGGSDVHVCMHVRTCWCVCVFMCICLHTFTHRHLRLHA
jgi:hypothetical protein